MIARWDGTAWRRVPAPSPAPLGASIALNGVAVASARSAWAVGYANGSSALILHWDGTAWRQVPSPNLPLADLNGVAAVSPANAWAVGDAGVTMTSATLILRWDGRVWRRVPSPAPGGRSALGGVAATSPGDVWAVGVTETPRQEGSVPTVP